MRRAEVEAYLHRHIPLSLALGVRVREASPLRVALQVPLEPNLNHQSTAFGGSVSALGILAGWTLLHLRLRAEGIQARSVIQKSEARFLLPVRGAFQAVAVAPEDAVWARFLATMERRGRGRVRLATRIEEDGLERAKMVGSYVSFAGEAD
jgi:thioesterase domain-containing protein